MLNLPHHIPLTEFVPSTHSACIAFISSHVIHNASIEVYSKNAKRIDNKWHNVNCIFHCTEEYSVSNVSCRIKNYYETEPNNTASVRIT
jgi:hypothetical protein